ncbi:hypothetical protein C5B42_04435 [Candidatus Cerribacteria bacterium 'Amazon FNV 2010 28 9']|uniref:ORC1/DEAH AAA+ ATPase domain-containing protein n=1 Tax=Candidatus Cerribacteria bacterium 'Amazon FNV 2010 28 9' TaxID=2081795 RepID=A0A317JNG0_9BACT|nr:MAG: hypothetical protein C5B42_04435 [Candidatus Cerribacteria bacterium 'Amazon FNV 2010 28 9']
MGTVRDHRRQGYMLITVFGRRGSGKTTMIRHMIPLQKRPVVVIDILGNFQNDDYPHVTTHSHIEALSEIKSYVHEPKKHPGIIVVFDSNMDRCVDYLSSALWKINGGTLVIDEADAISIPESPCFDEAIRYGRNHGINLITGCRRPAELSKNITAGSDLALCLTTHEPRDIEYYCDFLGDDLAAQLPTLKPHHGVYRDFINKRSGTFRSDASGKMHVITKVSRQPKAKQLELVKETQISCGNDEDIDTDVV